MAVSRLAGKLEASPARLVTILLVAAILLVTDLVPQVGLSPAAAQQRQRTIMDMLF
ncbi:MAG: hypothetical protein H7Y08_06440, partial [Rhizobiaceae bacterium]|nr:hypothetical protein [Rhizobiaceae bacterium]